MIHPARLMLRVWALCAVLYFILPFQLAEKALTPFGLGVFALYLSAFCLGTLGVYRRPYPARVPSAPRMDFTRTDALLKSTSILASLAYLIDLQGKSVLDLAVAYEMRSDQAGALLEGAASASSTAFQIGFLTYPAAYAFMARTIIFEGRVSTWKFALFGILPVLLATLATGGRSPLLYGIALCLLSIGARRLRAPRRDLGTLLGQDRKAFTFWTKAGIAMVVSAALVYFVAVFFTRAALLGGGAGMLQVAEDNWGVAFRGPVADVMLQILGADWTYIVFVFNWYVVQGLPMAGHIFSTYDGPMQFGIYGIDIVSALARRVDGALVASHFDALQRIGIYGFYPAAWGSLHVDLSYVGLLASALWGWFAGVAYRKVRLGADPRWLLLYPFLTMGILFSFINTPIGFANGLLTHLWVGGAFLTIKRLDLKRSGKPAPKQTPVSIPRLPPSGLSQS